MERLDNMKYKTPLKAIRAKCIDCCCGIRKEVEACELSKCPLYEFRLGTYSSATTESINFSNNNKKTNHLFSL